MSRHSSTVEARPTFEAQPKGKPLEEKYERLFGQLNDLCLRMCRFIREIDEIELPSELRDDLHRDRAQIRECLLDLKSDVMTLNLNVMNCVSSAAAGGSDDPDDEVDASQEDRSMSGVTSHAALTIILYGRLLEAGLVDENLNPSEEFAEQVKAYQREILERAGHGAGNPEAAES